MITRRELLMGSAGTLLLGSLSRAGFAATPAPADELIALPGKKPLIRRSYRPPNFETPLAGLRHEFTPNDEFFVRYHLAYIPQVSAGAWRLRVGGASAGKPMEFTLADLKKRFELVTVAAINQCSGNRRGMFEPRAPGVQWNYGAMGHARWTGVRLRDVLNAAGVKADAVEVIADGGDKQVMPGTPDYVKSIPIDRALDENTLIAFEMNGAPLPHYNGAPARLVVPGWTATYWVKHLSEIRVEPKPFDGFWVAKAYRVPKGAFPGDRFITQENADTVPITQILVNAMITSHENGARIARGQPAVVKGWAWDGGSGIKAVDVSHDGGKTWRPALLDRDLGRFAWRGFSVPVDTSKPGRRTVAIRATANNGARQADTLVPNASGYHHNIIQVLTLEVA